MPIVALSRLSAALVAALLLSACERIPPATRAPVTLPIYTQGDAVHGAAIYQETCAQCHQLQPGLNKKGPQLLNIYGAPAAQLADYDYSKGLAKSGWTWDAKTLDPYIADAEQAMPESKMLADPMPDASDRADVIAYLSTLRGAVSTSIKNADPKSTHETNRSKTATTSTQMSNEPVALSSDPSQKPAADFQ